MGNSGQKTIQGSLGDAAAKGGAPPVENKSTGKIGRTTFTELVAGGQLVEDPLVDLRTLNRALVQPNSLKGITLNKYAVQKEIRQIAHRLTITLLNSLTIQRNRLRTILLMAQITMSVLLRLLASR